MTLRYTTVSNHLPESKMRMYPTKVINIIGGPGSNKSLFSSAIVLFLNMHQKSVETVPDYAKSLVWQQDFEALKNQYAIAQRQFEMINIIDGQVQYIVTECSLPQVLYYNEHYEDNICDVGKIVGAVDAGASCGGCIGVCWVWAIGWHSVDTEAVPMWNGGGIIAEAG